MEPLISIIVPVYKAEAFLRRCLDSLLAQSYPNLEIILVDDGSPDSSGEICEEYARMHPNIRTIHQKNGGPASARNRGIADARGEYLGFVDTDDYAYPQMFRHLWNAISRTDAKLAICSFDCVDSNEQEIIEFAAHEPIFEGIYSAKDLLPKIVQTNGWAYVVPWNKLYHRSLLNPNFFPEGRYYEDEFVIAQLLCTAERIACIAEKEYHYYYLRKGSQTEGCAKVTQLDALEAIYQRCMFYHENGLNELIYDNRTIYLREMGKLFRLLDRKDKTVKKRLNQIWQWYGKIPGRKINETIRWYLIKISPEFENRLVEWVHR